MNGIPRRRWLQQCALAAAGLALPAVGAAAAGRTRLWLADENDKEPIRLSSNENPYGPGPKARAAMADAITASNRYGFQLTDGLKQKIGASLGVPADAVKLTAGSSELLGIMAMFWAARKGSGLTCVPTFDVCFRQAERWGLRFQQLPLTAGKAFDLAAMGRALQKNQLVYICNPNNPTGTFIPQESILALHKQLPENSLLLVDEAYLDYAGAESLAQHAARSRNLVVVRTFSKAHGLAGARVGYGIAHPDTVGELDAFQAWTNATLSVPAIHAAAASIGETEFLQRCIAINREQRERTAKELEGMGLRVIPSQTNFLYLGGVPAGWNAALQERGIFAGREVVDDLRWSRLTIGTPEDMNAFLLATRKILNK